MQPPSTTALPQPSWRIYPSQVPHSLCCCSLRGYPRPVGAVWARPSVAPRWIPILLSFLTLILLPSLPPPCPSLPPVLPLPHPPSPLLPAPVPPTLCLRTPHTSRLAIPNVPAPFPDPSIHPLAPASALPLTVFSLPTALFAALGLASELITAVNSLLDSDHRLSRMPSSGLHRQLKIQWHGRQLAVNTWQTGRVHVQGKGSGGHFGQLLSLAHASSLGPASKPSQPSITSFSSESPTFCESESPGRKLPLSHPWKRFRCFVSSFCFSCVSLRIFGLWIENYGEFSGPSPFVVFPLSCEPFSVYVFQGVDPT